jgi:hypothetical protein
MQNPWGGYGPPPGTYQPLVGMPGQMPAAQPTQQDFDHLKTLGICTLVYSGLVGLASLFGLVYVAIGVAMAVDPGGDPDAEAVGGIFAVMGMVICGIFAAKCILLIFSGIGLIKHKWRMASYIGAALSCMNMPLGTILGVFTFLVLGRPSVKALYDANSSS